MRSARLVLAGICLAAVSLLALVATLRTTDQAFTLGVVSSGPVVRLKAGQSVCQGLITVPAGGAFDRVAFALATFGRQGPAMQVSVRDDNGRRLGSGRLQGGYRDFTVAPRHAVDVGHIAERNGLSVCLANRGRVPVAVFGGPDEQAGTSTAMVGREPVHADLGLDFRRRPRSLATLTPRMFDRASLFRTPIAGTWLYVVLTVLLITLAPALLLRALRTASSD